MIGMKHSTLISVILGGVLSTGLANATTQSPENPSPDALAEGQNGVIVGTTGPNAVHAGLQTLKKGGAQQTRHWPRPWPRWSSAVGAMSATPAF